MKRPNRRPGASWSLRMPGPDVYPNGHVRTLDDDMIEIAFLEKPGVGDWITCSRGDARLLAKRINQCLDATRL